MKTSDLAILLILLILLFLSCTFGTDREEREEMHRLLETGKTEVVQGHMLEAMSHLQEAMSHSCQLQDSDALFQSGVFMAIVFDQTGQRDKAYALLKTLPYRDVAPDSGLNASLFYYRLMATYLTLIDHNYDTAVQLLHEAINVEQRIMPADTAAVYLDRANICEILYRSGDTAQALNMVRTLEQQPLASNQQYLSQVFYVHCCLLFDERQYDAAYALAEQALPLAQTYRSYDNILLLLDIEMRIDSIRGQLDRYISHRNAIERLNSRLRGSEVKAQMAAQAEQSRMEALKRAAENAQSRHRHWLFGMAVVIVGLIVILVIGTKNAKHKQRLALMQRLKLADSIEYERMEKELLQLKIQMKDAQLEQAYKDNVKMSVDKATDDDAMLPLRVLERTMREQHGDMLQRAADSFPQLTAGDLRLLGFIHMGLSSHDMAAALSITQSSLNTSRYRLRKKLGLDPSTDLADFIASL